MKKKVEKKKKKMKRKRDRSANNKVQKTNSLRMGKKGKTPIFPRIYMLKRCGGGLRGKANKNK